MSTDYSAWTRQLAQQMRQDEGVRGLRKKAERGPTTHVWMATWKNFVLAAEDLHTQLLELYHQNVDPSSIKFEQGPDGRWGITIQWTE